jgi:hypothetical protein
VEDELGTANRVVDALVAAQLAFNDLDIESLQVAADPGREVVEYAYVVASLDEMSDEVRADEAGSTGNQYLHEPASTWRPTREKFGVSLTRPWEARSRSRLGQCATSQQRRR